MRCRIRGFTLPFFLLLSTVVAETPGVWIDVPFVRQEREGCGSAAVAMLMGYWSQREEHASPPPPPEELHRILYSPEAGGTYAHRLREYLEENGYVVFTFRGNWSDLEHHLRQGRPLIVATQPGESDPRHFSVVAGVDRVRGIVLLNDPARRKLFQETKEHFKRAWSNTEYWTLLALPRVEAASTEGR